jgi:hypothetical protein
VAVAAITQIQGVAVLADILLELLQLVVVQVTQLLLVLEVRGALLIHQVRAVAG